MITAPVHEPERAVGTSAVTLDNIVKFFGRFVALRGVTAEFPPARLYVIMGDNGAGKSTLLRVMTGLLSPSSGNIKLLGESPEDVRARYGYMGHAPFLYDELTAMENLRYFGGLYGLTNEDILRDAIRTVGLDPALDRRVGQYSQGMRQRMSLARAVIHSPEVLFLDEPFSNVDARSAKEMALLLGQMRDAGRTVFVVTHQAAVLEPYADEFVLMDAGQIVSRYAGGTA